MLLISWYTISNIWSHFKRFTDINLDINFIIIDNININIRHPIDSAVVRRCSIKKMVLEISQNSLANTCAIVSF